MKKIEKKSSKKYVLVRGDRSGVFTGWLKSNKNRIVVLNQARRLWYWSGASSISEIAMRGVSKPNQCKFPCEVTELLITDAIELMEMTETARKNIASVPVWSS